MQYLLTDMRSTAKHRVTKYDKNEVQTSLNGESGRRKSWRTWNQGAQHLVDEMSQENRAEK